VDKSPQLAAQTHKSLILTPRPVGGQHDVGDSNIVVENRHRFAKITPNR